MTQNNANHCPSYPLNIQKWLCRHSLNSKTCFFPSVLFSFQIFCFCFTLFAIKYLSLVWTKAKKFFRPHSCNFSMSKLPKMFPVITLPGNSYWKSFFGWKQQSTSEVSCLGECWERFSMIKRLAILACGFSGCNQIEIECSDRPASRLCVFYDIHHFSRTLGDVKKHP